MQNSSHMLLAFWGLTTPMWIAMWSLLALSTIALIVLVRTRWSTNRTWRMCAVLSLWVHVLIVVFSMTVRIVTGAPQAGDGEPIRVAVLPAEPFIEASESESDEIQPVWEAMTAPPLVAPAAEPLPSELEEENEQPTPDTLVMQEITESLASAEPLPPAPPLEAPALMPAPIVEEPKLEEAQVRETKPAESEVVESEPQEDQPQVSAIDESLGSRLRGNDGKTENTASPQLAPNSREVSTSSEAIPNLYADRFAEDLTELATERGGSSQTEAAVKAALAWLAANQSENGGWDASKFGAGKELVVLGHNRQGAGAEADTGVTGLAILAFLGSGHSHLHGVYRNEVAAALEFLRQRQRSDGSLFGEAELFARMYCHSMATLAACEAYAMTRDERLDPMCRAAVGYSLSMQHPTDGGWRYRRGDTGDTSQLGWQLMALKSAKLAGIPIPDITWARAERFLRRVKRGNHGGLASYRPDGPPTRTMTAEAWYCHQLLQADRGGSLNPTAIREAIESLEQEMPAPSNRNLYYWYYATLALQQNQHDSPEDTASWESWNHALTTALIATQESDGSWNADTVWGGYGGKVYTTSLSALCLEVYYRYNPAQGPSEIADREGWQSLQR
ncbi:MAG: prenyltransferase/squalene oxidase repeat-containing protein [Bythopirellula sp.]|nr:prenyltransferase/squalene oxidase repeat-containing protein [Bythopirellula sp.]